MNAYETVKPVWLWSLAVVAGMLFENLARAVVLTVPLEAVVVYVEDGGGYLGGAIQVGDRIHGSYTYETTTADSQPWPSVGDYWHYTPPFGINLEVNGVAFVTDPASVEFLVEVGNDFNGRDNYVLQSYHNLFDLSVPDVWGLGVMNHISWQLDDPSTLALSSDALPYGMPHLADWEQVVGLDITSDGGSGTFFHVRALVVESPIASAEAYSEVYAGLALPVAGVGMMVTPGTMPPSPPPDPNAVAGLRAAWRLDGDAHDAKGSYHGVTSSTGIVTPTDSRFTGSAMHFDQNGWINFGDADLFTGSFTVAGWIRTSEPAQTEVWRTWLYKLDYDRGEGPVELLIQDGRSISITDGEGGFSTTAPNGPLGISWRNQGIGEVNLFGRVADNPNARDGQWHHVAFTYEAGNQWLYFDGRPLMHGNYAGPLHQTSAPLRIGGGTRPDGRVFGPYHYYWVGDVDEVLVYGRALAGAEVAYLAGAEPGPQWTTLVAPVVGPVCYGGAVSDVGAYSLTDEAADWSDDRFNGANGSFYVQLAEGTVVDIMGTDGAAQSLTLADALPPEIVPGTRYSIRRHLTIADLFGANNEAGLLGGLEPSTADDVLLLQPATQETLTVFWYDDGVGRGWLNASYDWAAGQVVRPGQGLMLQRKAPVGTTAYLCGGVAALPARIRVEPGWNLLGTLKCAEATALSELGLRTGSAATGFAGGHNPSESDNLLLLQPNGASATYFHYQDGQGEAGWRDAAFNPADGIPISPGRAFLVRRREPGGGFSWMIPHQ